MIEFYIPQNNKRNINTIEIIEKAIGKVPMRISSNGIIQIQKNLTRAEINLLKAAFATNTSIIPELKDL